MRVCLAAGNAFCQAARLHMQLQNKLDSATSFVDAGNAYKKADPQGERKPSFPLRCPIFCSGLSHLYSIKYLSGTLFSVISRFQYIFVILNMIVILFHI